MKIDRGLLVIVKKKKMMCLYKWNANIYIPNNSEIMCKNVLKNENMSMITLANRI